MILFILMKTIVFWVIIIANILSKSFFNGATTVVFNFGVQDRIKYVPQKLVCLVYIILGQDKVVIVS